MVRKWQNGGVFAACTYLISCIFVAKVANWLLISAVGGVVSAEIHCVTAVAWCNAAVDTLKSAKSYCIFSECCAGFLYFGCQFCGLVVLKWRLVVWLLGFRVWFLYDLVADAAFGNL